MSNLPKVQKNGSLAQNKTIANYPEWSSWIDSMFPKDLPVLMMQNFSTGITTPKVNIKETPDSFIVEMAVPGLKKEDFVIELNKKVLSVSFEKNEEETQEHIIFKQQEFGYTSFKRTFTVPETAEESKIKASYEEGVLRMFLPKKEEAKPKPSRKINIT